MQQRVEDLETQLQRAANPRETDAEGAQPQVQALIEPVQPNRSVPSNHTRQPRSVKDISTTLNFSCSLGAFPASALTGHPIDDRGQTPNTNLDLIAKGILSEYAAQELYDFYCAHMAHLIYDQIPTDVTISDLRIRSSLLTAAICTVAAYCRGSEHYQDSLAALRSEVTTEVFSKQHTFDDVRALCIGSFWLPDLSATLSALG